MLPLQSGIYTASQVDSALHSENREIHFKYNLLDNTNTFKKVLSTVISGHVENNCLATIKRMATFVMLDDTSVNFLSDRIQPWICLKITQIKGSTWYDYGNKRWIDL